jgi:fatty-acyl-CoA synthase
MECPLLVDDFLNRPAAVYPEKTAVVDGERRYSYREFQGRVNRLSHALLALGIRRGDRVSMLSANSHFFLESFFGSSRIGAVLVPLNYRLAAPEQEYILNHAGVKAALVGEEYTPLLDAIRSRLPAIEHWIAARDVAGGKTGDLPPGWKDWDRLIAGSPESQPPPVERGENDLVSINYTSGTTARPKGVMLTHRNSYLNAYNLIAHLRVSHEDVELWTLPMFHCNGWGGVYAVTGMGGTHVVLRSPEPGEIFRLIEAEGVTLACMAPAVLGRILEYPHRSRHTLRTRPRLVVAGAPPPAAFIERLERELGWEFLQIYGLTETAPLLTISAPDHNTAREDWPRRARAGVAGLGVELALLDPQGSPVPRDGKSIGEVCARSNVVMRGYWEDPQETARALRGGWFHSGDLAVWDAVGNVHIVDRMKDVIISGGENISSAEVEDVLYRHPAVLECAVIGVPHEVWGETPRAVVVLKNGEQATAEELRDFCRSKLAHFKCPTSVEFLPALPRTATGKLQKFLLREKHWQGRERRVN